MLAGEYEPGDRLPAERERMAQFAAGRGTVREALIALQRMGLVSLSAGERALVSRPTAGTMINELSGAARQLLAAPDGIRHFQQARRLLECALAAEAASRVTAEGLAQLHEALEANRKARDVPRAITTDMQFHYRIAAMAGNPVLTALHTALGEWLAEQRTTSVQVTGARRAANLAHRRIHDAIAARDPQAAAAAMRQHLQEVEAFYWRSSARPETFARKRRSPQ